MNNCDRYHGAVRLEKARGWGAGALVFGLGAILAVGALPGVANAAETTNPAPPWAAGASLPVAGLGPETVGFHATTPATQDQAALPQHAAERVTVDVTDFGADPTGVADSAKAVNDAILHAKSLKKPTTIVFPCGNYAMYPENAPKRELYISNTVGADQSNKIKAIGVLLEDMDDVIIEGNGSQLTYHGKQTEFATIRSTDVTIRNLATDWYAPGTLDLAVVGSGVADGFGYRDIQVPAGVTHTINGATATFTGEKSPVTGQPYWSYEPGAAGGGHNQTRDLATGLTLRTGVPLWNGSRSVTDLGGGVLRVSYNNTADPGGAGKVYEMRKTTRDTSGALIWESERTSLANLKLHYLHGFGIVGQLSRDIALDKITMRTDFGTGRQTAAFADFVQMSGVAGKVQITNSLFDNPHDDPINIHGTYVQVKAIDRTAKTVTLQYMHNETAGFPQFYPGDELRFVKKATMLPAGSTKYTVTAVNGPNGMDTSHNLTQMTVTVDGELPADLAVDAFVAENLTYTPEVYIAGNTFQSVPTRGILVTTPREVLIERNVFDQMGMASIFISADAANWYESSGAEDVTIRNNVFDRPTSNAATIFVEPTNGQNEAGRTVHNNISIEANRFSVLNNGQLVNAKSVTGLDFTDNVVNHYAPTDPVSVTSTRALFDFRSSADIEIAGNEYQAGFNLRANTSGMDAAQVNGTADNIAKNADNIQRVTGPASTLAAGMAWIREDGSKWTAVDKNTVTMRAGSSGLWATQNAAVNILHRSAPIAGDGEVLVKLSGATKSSYEEAGVIMYGNDDNYVALQRKHANGSPVLAVVTEANGSANENTKIAAPANADVWLKLVRAGNQYTGSYSLDGTSFTAIGTITNAAVAATAKAGVLAVGSSTGNTPFTFSEFKINGTAQPFFDSVILPEPAQLVAGLEAPVWEGVQFGAAISPLAWLANTPAATKQVSASITPELASTSVQVQFNDDAVTAGSNGKYTFKLLPGPNVVQVQTLGADGVSSQTYRWVINQLGPLNGPGKNFICTPVIEPSAPATPLESAAPSPVPTESAQPSVVPTESATPSLVPTESPTPSVVPTESAQPSLVPTESVTPSLVPTESAAPSLVPSESEQPSERPSSSAAPVAPGSPGESRTAGSPQSSASPSPEAGGLANTGANLLPVMVGLAAAAAGAIMMMTGRRRRA